MVWINVALLPRLAAVVFNVDSAVDNCAFAALMSALDAKLFAAGAMFKPLEVTLTPGIVSPDVLLALNCTLRLLAVLLSRLVPLNVESLTS